MKSKHELSGIYYILSLVGVYAIKEVLQFQITTSSKVYITVFILLSVILFLYSASKNSNEYKSFSQTQTHLWCFDLFKKLFYCRCYSYEDFLNISSEEYIETFIKEKTENCINWAIDDFISENKLSSVITFSLFKDKIRNEMTYNNLNVKIYGFFHSEKPGLRHYISISPYDLKNDLLCLSEVIADNQTYKQHPIPFDNTSYDYIRINKIKFPCTFKSEFQPEEHSFYIITGKLDIKNWQLYDCTAVEAEYGSFKNLL